MTQNQIQLTPGVVDVFDVDGCSELAQVCPLAQIIYYTESLAFITRDALTNVSKSYTD